MGKTREEFVQEQNEAASKAGQEFADAQRKDAEKARDDQADSAETEEEYYARLQGARTSGIFGDTDTTAGTGANLTQVPSADNEAATVAVAEADASEEGSEEANASDDEARRQVDIAGGQPSAEEVETGANENDDSNDNNDSGTLAKDQVTAIENASTVEEVDSIAKDDDRKTVKDAADKRRGELDSTDAGPASDAGQEAGGSEEAPNADAVVEDAQPQV